MSTVATVAFAFMNPDAIRVFLQIAGYRVSVFDGTPESLDLRKDKPEANIVILPNFAKRDLLAGHADQIERLVVLTNGKHESIVDLNIPILDGEIDGDTIRQARDRSPHFYTKKIKEAAAPLDLTVVLKAVEAPKATAPETLDQWFDVLDRVLPAEHSFDHDVEYPVCQFLIGQLSQKDMKGALKVLVQDGADKDIMRSFYQWLVQRADVMSKAMRAYLMPATESAAMTTAAAAKKYRVDPTDVALLESIYLEMQKQVTETDEGEADDA